MMPTNPLHFRFSSMFPGKSLSTGGLGSSIMQPSDGQLTSDQFVRRTSGVRFEGIKGGELADEGLPVLSQIRAILDAASADETLDPTWKASLKPLKLTDLLDGRGSSYINEDMLFNLLRLKGQLLHWGYVVSPQRQEQFNGFLDELSRTRSSLSAEEEAMLEILLFLPVPDKQWEGLLHQTRIAATLFRSEEMTQMLDQFFVEPDPKQPDALELTVDTLKCLLDANIEAERIQKLYLWFLLQQSPTRPPKERYEPLKTVLDTLSDTHNLAPDNLQAIQCLATMPVDKASWNKVMAAIQKQAENRVTFPFMPMLEAAVNLSPKTHGEWLKKLETMIDEAELDSHDAFYHTAMPLWLKHNPDAIPAKRIKVLNPIVSKQAGLPDNLSKADYTLFKRFATMPVPDAMWDMMADNVKMAAKGDTFSDTLFNMVAVGYQQLVKQGQSELPWVQDVAVDLAGEVDTQSSGNRLFTMLLEVDANPMALDKPRQAGMTELLKKMLVVNAPVNNHTESVLQLFARLPVSQPEWRAINDGVQLLLEKNPKLDLVEVMVQALLDDDVQRTVPGDWLTQLSTTLTTIKHPRASLVAEKLNLTMTLATGNPKRQSALQGLLSNVWKQKVTFSEKDQLGFNLLASMPIDDVLWQEKLKALNVGLAENKLKLGETLLAALPHLDKEASQFGTWLAELKTYLGTIGHGNTTAVDLYLDYTPKETTGRSARMGQLVSKLTAAGIQSDLRTKKAIDMLATAPFEDAYWNKTMDAWQAAAESKRFEAPELLAKSVLSYPGIMENPLWLKSALAFLGEKPLDSENAKYVMESLKYLLEIPDLSPVRRKVLANWAQARMMKPKQAAVLLPTPLCKMLATAPIGDDQWMNMMNAAVNATVTGDVAERALFKTLAPIYFLGDSEKPDVTAWRSLFYYWVQTHRDAWSEFNNLHSQYESIKEILPYLKAATPEELQAVVARSPLNPGYEGDFDEGYGDDDFPSADEYFDGYSMASTGDETSFSSPSGSVSLTPTEKAAAEKLFAKYPLSLFTMGLSKEELVEIGVEKQLLDDFDYWKKAQESLDTKTSGSGYAPMAAASSGYGGGPSPTSTRNRKKQADPQANLLASLPSTIGSLYYRAWRGDEKAMAELIPKILLSDKALTLMSPLVSRIESQMDQYAGSHRGGKQIHPNLAELFLLLKNPQAQAGDKLVNRVTSAITSIDRFINYGLRVNHRIVKLWADIGMLTHGFRFWRFDSQGGPNGLMGKFGFKPLNRPKTDDIFGKGYLISKADRPDLSIDSNTKVEFRRGYLLVTHPTHGTLLIRNSSLVFGRDLLNQPAFYLPQGLTESDIMTLNPQNERGLMRILAPELYQDKNFVGHLEFLLGELKQVKQDFARWKFNPEAFLPNGEFTGDKTQGMREIIEKLSNQYAEFEMGLTDKPPQALAMVHPDYPPYEGYEFVDTEGLDPASRRFILNEARMQELQDRMTDQWTTEKYPDSDWVNFIQKGVEKNAELVLVDAPKTATGVSA